MELKPEYIRPNYKGCGKLNGKVALITGGDSGIGRSIAIHYAREGADVAISYLNIEDKDANITKDLVEKEGRRCLLLPGDLKDKSYCNDIVDKTVKEFGKLNILVNNAGMNRLIDNFTQLKDEDIEEVFNVNILAQFRVTRAALNHMKERDCIIMNSSVNAYKGNQHFVDYSETKEAVMAFVRSLALQWQTKR